jgi:dTDP-4-amino-4,6-dideoxygalactose transaminase
LIDVPAVCRVERHRRLLRYPLLVPPEWRDRLYLRLRNAGLGASRLYPSSLPHIPGLGSQLEGQGDFPAAEALAARMLTLPTHVGVRDHDVRKIGEILVADCI